MKKSEKEIIVNQKDISMTKILLTNQRITDKLDTFPMKDKLAALVLADIFIKSLKDAQGRLMSSLGDTPLEDVLRPLTEEGGLAEGETPVGSVIDNSGKKHSVTVVSGVKKGLLDMKAFSAYAENPDHFRDLPEDFKEKKLKSKSFFAKKYAAEELGAYNRFFSKGEDEIVTKLKEVRRG